MGAWKMKSKIIFGIGFAIAAFGQYRYLKMRDEKAKKIADEVLGKVFS
jgi:hypothetical protein